MLHRPTPHRRDRPTRANGWKRPPGCTPLCYRGTEAGSGPCSPADHRTPPGDNPFPQSSYTSDCPSHTAFHGSSAKSSPKTSRGS
ncbi:hypothetical protein GDO81_022060 [Engystomops pustulosus]|uniref:Uncharacterized protein n=1 Tax=Engystomops pustulosus TaxID=76066 RepID=A0AAV6YMY7_ENGPU|nr:hypothetical protein GDO81_022060 [Engystomops pustulosus]